jgi:hypothetical protein
MNLRATDAWLFYPMALRFNTPERPALLDETAFDLSSAPSWSQARRWALVEVGALITDTDPAAFFDVSMGGRGGGEVYSLYWPLPVRRVFSVAPVGWDGRGLVRPYGPSINFGGVNAAWQWNATGLRFVTLSFAALEV